jgi:NADH:ubiquinone oxidoreductase subunit 5 (subunit L)/multisubunit Na+/H+ antiporter MnhA subunit
MAAVVIAAFAIKFEILRIFRDAQTEIFRPDAMPVWMVRVMTVLMIAALLLGFYFAWQYPSRRLQHTERNHSRFASSGSA